MYYTHPNQLIIKINKSKMESGFSMMGHEELREAYKNLTPSGLALYLYFMENKDNYTSALSPADFCKKYGLSESSYRRAKRELKDKGYIVDRESNKVDFYSQPQSEKTIEEEIEELTETLKNVGNKVCAISEEKKILMLDKMVELDIKNVKDLNVKKVLLKEGLKFAFGMIEKGSVLEGLL